MIRINRYEVYKNTAPVSIPISVGIELVKTLESR
jgi:hypothetical protein